MKTKLFHVIIQRKTLPIFVLAIVLMPTMQAFALTNNEEVITNYQSLVISNYKIDYGLVSMVKAVANSDAPPKCTSYISTSSMIQNECVHLVFTTIPSNYATAGSNFTVTMQVENTGPNWVHIPTQLVPQIKYVTQTQQQIPASTIVPNINTITTATPQVFPLTDAQNNSLIDHITCNLSSPITGILSPYSQGTTLSYKCKVTPWSYVEPITIDKLAKDNFQNVVESVLPPFLDQIDLIFTAGKEAYVFLLTGSQEQQLKELVDYGYFTAGVSYTLGFQQNPETNSNNLSKPISVIVFAPQEIIDAAEADVACHVSMGLGSDALTISTIGISVPAEVGGATIASESLSQSYCDIEAEKLAKGNANIPIPMTPEQVNQQEWKNLHPDTPYKQYPKENKTQQIPDQNQQSLTIPIQYAPNTNTIPIQIYPPKINGQNVCLDYAFLPNLSGGIGVIKNIDWGDGAINEGKIGWGNGNDWKSLNDCHDYANPGIHTVKIQIWANYDADWCCYGISKTPDDKYGETSTDVNVVAPSPPSYVQPHSQNLDQFASGSSNPSSEPINPSPNSLSDFPWLYTIIAGIISIVIIGIFKRIF